MVSGQLHAPTALPPGEEAPVFNKPKAGWAVWTFQTRGKSRTPDVINNPDRFRHYKGTAL
jgi:hypothetical protein